MKVTLEEKKEKSKDIVFPFVVRHWDSIVLVLGHSIKNPITHYRGIMLNSNGYYPPCTYENGNWLKSDCLPFHGKIVIEC